MLLDKTLDVAAKRVTDLDHRSHELFEPLADHPAMRAVDLFSKLGDQPEVRTIAGFLLAAGIFGASDRLVRAGARMILAHEAATLAKDGIKSQIDRVRPRSATSKRETKVRKGTSTAKEMTSFPSGHSAGAFAAARAFSREFPEYRWAAFAVAAAAALSQQPRRAHYPSDIAGGMLVGLAAEGLTDAAWRATAMDERSES